jgi:hypothetical protein
MSVKSYKNYSKIYEAKLQECEFFTENQVTTEDIINPLEDLITEDFISRIDENWLGDTWEKGKKFVKGVYTSVKDAISRFFTGVVNFFKNFSITKLIKSIWTKIKEIGTALWAKIKNLFSGFRDFILGNGLCDENNKPQFGKIWSTICDKTKSVVNLGQEGVTPDKLKEIGSKVKLDTSGINEADSKYSIGDDEVKYYGMFEKIAHAMGIRNARANGVVSQIMQKSVIGVAIMGIMNLAGFSFAGIAASLGLGPVALAAIGGMLLMAGIIILAIWISKPYPTVDDCLSYLHLAFGGHLQQANVPNVFVTNVHQYYITNTAITSTAIIGQTNLQQNLIIPVQLVQQARPVTKMYAVMVTNLKILRRIILNINTVTIQAGFKGVGDGGPLPSRNIDLPKKQKVGGGPAGDYVTKQNQEELDRIKKQQRKLYTESYILPFSLFEGSVEISKEETQLAQAFQNLSNAVKYLKSEEAGVSVTDDFLQDILDEKMDSEAKEEIKDLYADVYDFMYGKKSATLTKPENLYNESIKDLSKENRQVLAEKIARFALRSLQFEGENMYGGLGDLGKDLKEFNETFKEIMASYKSEEKEEDEKEIPTYSSTPIDQEDAKAYVDAKESFRYITSFENYKNK